jgi:hypothetical protein
MAFQSKADSGKKPKVRDSKPHSDDHPPARIGIGSARGGQPSPRPVVKAKEKSTKPVTGGGMRSTGGWVRGQDHAKDPTIP